MPNRIIKESIHESEKVNALTDFQFRLWVSLITYVDDYGRGDVRPAIIQGHCFPLRESVTKEDIAEALAALSAQGLVALYTAEGRQLLCLPHWERHQRIQQKRSKYPAPDAAAGVVATKECPDAAASGETEKDRADIAPTAECAGCAGNTAVPSTGETGRAEQCMAASGTAGDDSLTEPGQPPAGETPAGSAPGRENALRTDNAPRRNSMPKADNPQWTGNTPTTDHAPRTERTLETEGTLRTDKTPGTDNALKTDRVPGTDSALRTKYTPGPDNAPRTGRARRTDRVPQSETPSAAKVAAYVRTQGLRVDPSRFYEYYAARGWQAGGHPMGDWRACVRAWAQRDAPGRVSAEAARALAPEEYTGESDF